MHVCSIPVIAHSLGHNHCKSTFTYVRNVRTYVRTFIVVAIGKQRVPTSARVPIFDAARLLREFHAQAATVNVSLEGQRAPAIVLARDQTLQRSKLAAASSFRAGCSSSAYMLMQ